ncbi:hypothetical protein BDB00DRAFT_874157 [Zychaea mexicana]|uniref:uncharacterized protein n=1 Tax=Zychaea mexicana TaxID=64656 RepID=UPI0022FE8B5D|nr:uncharacterized protein BDB00DRAFT_874157 [Zychaea mexicana]KAI9491594.1 hypothetical protein BDB00DRAFT_874157 [Zychaea mexicana]
MSPQCPSLIFVVLLIFATLAHHAYAQVGPDVKTPEFNATVTPGDRITIEYEYQNVGTGNYTVEIDLWEDSGKRYLLQNVCKDEPLAGGNSTGVQLNFTMSATYDWTVPGDLTHKVSNEEGEEVDEAVDMFFLTVTAVADTYFYEDLALTSRPVRLHYNAAALALPNKLLLLALAVPVSLFYFFGV